MEPANDTLYHVLVTYTDGTTKAVIVDAGDLDGLNWEHWIRNFETRSNARPQWGHLGSLTFHSQGVRSIELLETIERGDEQ